MRNQGRGRGGGWLAHDRLGYNYRLSDINCALGIVQLSRLEEFIQKRAHVARMYQDNLAGDDRLIVPYWVLLPSSWRIAVPRTLYDPHYGAAWKKRYSRKRKLNDLRAPFIPYFGWI